jgi:hypothetical protein
VTLNGRAVPATATAEGGRLTLSMADDVIVKAGQNLRVDLSIGRTDAGNTRSNLQG